jgi:AhpD family alkylhydroperoxidase
MEARLDILGTPSIIANIKRLSAAGHLPDGILPSSTQELCRLRASQINGCGFCTDMHIKDALADGEDAQRLHLVAAWREATCFTDAERAALELAEAVTRVADRGDPVSDEVWADAARHYDEQGIAALLIAITGVNVWNRLNAATHQVAGAWTP